MGEEDQGPAGAVIKIILTLVGVSLFIILIYYVLGRIF